VVEVQVADQDAGAAVPGIAGVDAGQRLRLADRDQVRQLPTRARPEPQREGDAAGSVLPPEVEKAAGIAVLDQELEAGRVAGMQEAECRSCADHVEPTIIAA